MKAMMGMATSRRRTVESERDRKACTKLAFEDYLNSIHMMPRDVKILSLVSDFGMPEDIAAQAIDTLEANAETSPLTMLQPIHPSLCSSAWCQIMKWLCLQLRSQVRSS